MSLLDVFRKDASRDPVDDEDSRDLTLDVNSAVGSHLPDPGEQLFSFGAITIDGGESLPSNHIDGAWYAYDPSCHQLLLIVDGSYVGDTFELSVHPQLRDDWVFAEHEVLTLDYVQPATNEVAVEDESAFALTWVHGFSGLGAFLLPFGSSGDATATSLVAATNEAPTIAVSANTFVEDDPALVEGAVVATFLTADQDGDNVSVSFTDGGSPVDESGAALYTLDTASNQVRLTAAGVAHVNAGKDLPEVRLTATDDGFGSLTSSAADDPSVTKVNDAPTVEVLANDFTEDDPDLAENAVVAIYETFDEDGDNVSVSFTDGNSPLDESGAPLYTLDTASNQVRLTAAGVAHVNAGKDLPEVRLTATEDSAEGLTGAGRDDPEVTTVNDAPTVEVLANDFTEDDPNLAENAAVAIYETFDEDGDNVSVSFTDGGSPVDESGAPLYTLDTASNQVRLTAAGVAHVNAGKDLPEVRLTATEDSAEGLTGTGRDDPEVTTVNDAPTIEVLANDFTEDDPNLAENAVVAIYETFDEDGDNVTVSFTDGNSPVDESGEALYTLDTASNQVKLTAAGVAHVNAGKDLPEVRLTATEDSAEGLTGTGRDDPEVTTVNDAPTVLLDAQRQAQDNTAVFTEELAKQPFNGNAFTTLGVSLSDTDSDNLSSLTLSIDKQSLETGDQLVLASTTIDLTQTGQDSAEVTLSNTTFSYVFDNTGDNAVVKFSSVVGVGDTTEAPAAIEEYEKLLDGLTFNHITDQFTDGSTRIFTVVVNDGVANSNTSSFTVSLDALKDDLLLGTSDSDSLDGLGGDDVLIGGAGDDTLRGWEGDDYILGGTGNDFIRGNEGDDIVDGGSGDDVFDFDTNEENFDYQDIFIGGTGIDTVQFADSLASYQLGFVNDEQRSFLNNLIITDSELFRDADASDGFDENESIFFVQKVDSTNELSLYQSGYLQAEFLQFSDVTLTLDASSVQTIIATDPTSPLIFQGVSTGNSSWMPVAVSGGTESDRLVSGFSNDSLIGKAGDDVLVSRGGNDAMSGNDGNDVLVVLASNEGSQAERNVSMHGGDGEDAFTLKYLDGTDHLDLTIEDFVVGEDVINLDGIYKTEVNTNTTDPIAVSDILNANNFDFSGQQININFSEFLNGDEEALGNLNVTVNLSENVSEESLASVFSPAGTIPNELSGSWWDSLLSESGVSP